MEKIYEKSEKELASLGWSEERSIFCEGCMTAVWTKKGELANWKFVMQKEDEEENVTCMMVLKLAKQVGAKMEIPPSILECTGVETVIEALKEAMVRLLNRELKGGCVWQNV